MLTASDNFVTFTGDGSTTAFAFDKAVYLGTSLKVYTYDSSSDDAPVLVSADDYTVAVETDFSGATVTFDTAPASGIKIGILREIDLSQDVDISDTEYVPPSTLEKMLDRAVMMAQQVSRAVAGALQTDKFGFGTAYDAGSKKIINMADGVADDDAATVGQLDALLDDADTAVTAAQAAQSGAEAAQTAAETAQTGAETAQTAAETAQGLAETAQAAAEAAAAGTTPVEEQIHAAGAASIADADEIGFVDTSASNGLAKITWTNFKAALKTYLDTIYQPLNATLTSWAGKSVPSGSVVGTSDTQTLSSKTLTDPAITGSIKEDVFTITDAAGFAINPRNGSIQKIALGANRTPTATGWVDGDSVTLLISDGSGFAVTWSTIGVVWKDGVAPTLATSGYTEVNITRENSVYRGVHVGDFAS